MKQFCLGMFIVLCAFVHIMVRADDPPTFQIYITNEKSGDVSVIDSSSW